MKVYLSLIGLAVTLVAVVVAGFVVPQRTIANSVEKYHGEDKARARAALKMARLYADDTFDEVLVTAYRVERVGECPGPPPSDPPDDVLCVEGCGDPDSESSGVGIFGAGYFSMEVRKFTIFGLPYGKESRDCDDPL
jgi:hypothetical protein